MLGLARPVTADCEALVMNFGIIYVIRSQSSRCVKFWLNTLDVGLCGWVNAVGVWAYEA